MHCYRNTILIPILNIALFDKVCDSHRVTSPNMEIHDNLTHVVPGNRMMQNMPGPVPLDNSTVPPPAPVPGAGQCGPLQTGTTFHHIVRQLSSCYIWGSICSDDQSCKEHSVLPSTLEQRVNRRKLTSATYILDNGVEICL